MSEQVRYDLDGNLITDTVISAPLGEGPTVQPAPAVAGAGVLNWLACADALEFEVEEGEEDCCVKAEAFRNAYRALCGAGTDVNDCCACNQAYDDLRYITQRMLGT